MRGTARPSSTPVPAAPPVRSRRGAALGLLGALALTATTTVGLAAPALARAVNELTATVKRVEALAETWEEAARLVEARGGDAETVRDILQDVRTALNGDDQ